MKFFYAKHPHICLYCRAEISQGEPFVRLIINNRQGGKIGLIFHPECYPRWNEEKFNQRFLNWLSNQIPPRKRGRPRKYKDSVEANRLKTRQNQYRKAGNEDRVKELEIEIKEMEVENVLS